MEGEAPVEPKMTPRLRLTARHFLRVFRPHPSPPRGRGTRRFALQLRANPMHGQSPA
jgi:hypothetical protein